MAKQTKTIKCPQCASTSNIQLKDDYYKCSSCGTQYYLDSDDININVTHRIEDYTEKNKKTQKPAIAIMAFISIALMLIVVLINNNRGNSSSDWPYGSIMLDIPVEVKGKMYLLTLSNSKDKDGESFYSFTDFETKEIVKSEKLQGVKKLNNSIDNCNLRKFSNGDIYIIVDQQKLFKFDNDKMELRNIIQNLVETDSIYRSGIASIATYTGQIYGDCFQIMTNMGKQYYYFPRIRQSFPDKNLFNLSKGAENLRADSKEATKYQFSNKRRGIDIDAIDAIQLYKISYQDNGGGPNYTNFSPEWNRVGDSLHLEWNNASRMVSYKNLTPDRLYFNPDIFYADKDYLLVKVTATASEKSTPSLQRINTITGELMWTIPLELKNSRYIYYFNRALHADKKFALKLNDELRYLLVSEDGKDAKYFSLRD